MTRDGTGAPVDQRIQNRAGFRRRVGEGIEYLVLPEAWRSEVCVGLDAGAAAKTLAERGILETGSDGKPQVKCRLPNISGTARCYVVRSHILAEADETSARAFG